MHRGDGPARARPARAAPCDPPARAHALMPPCRRECPPARGHPACCFPRNDATCVMMVTVKRGFALRLTSELTALVRTRLKGRGGSRQTTHDPSEGAGPIVAYQVAVHQVAERRRVASVRRIGLRTVRAVAIDDFHFHSPDGDAPPASRPSPARGVLRTNLPEERTMTMFSLWYLNKYANAMCAALKLI